MTVQWIALGITIVMAIIATSTTLYQSSQSQKAAAASERARADIAQLKLDIGDKIDTKLDDFVRAQTMKDYIEGHAKEHRTLEAELTRLRDWKDDTDGKIRHNNTEAKELGTAIDDIKKILKDIKQQTSAS